jgi:pseudouridine synthase
MRVRAFLPPRAPAIHRRAPLRRRAGCPIVRDMTAAGKRTLDRLICRMGVCSRRQAEAAIRQGRVQVNGRVVRDPQTWVDVVRDKVVLDGDAVRARAKEHWLLHKPVGYVTTAADEHGRETVYALLPKGLTWLAPVGRLDRDSSGLLLFTNDHDLALAILQPSGKLPKTYDVRIKDHPSAEDVRRLREGIELHDGMTLPAQVDEIERNDRSTVLRFVLTEGRNRQIRRMVMAIGSRVYTLHRTRIGPLELGDLPAGACRRLTAEELTALRASVSGFRPPAPKHPRVG